MFNAAPFGILEVHQGRVVAANPASEALMGAPASVLENRLVETLFEPRLTHLETSADSFKLVRSAVGPNQQRIKVHARALDGQRLALFLTPANSSDRNLQLVSALSDVSARIQQARSADALLDELNVGLTTLGYSFGVGEVSSGQIVLREMGVRAGTLSKVERLVGRKLRGTTVGRSVLPQVDQVAAERRPLYVDDLVETAVGFFSSSVGRLVVGLRAVLWDGPPQGIIVPILVRGDLWGVLGITGRNVMPDDAVPFALFGAQLGSALEAVMSVEELARSARQLSSLTELGTHVAQQLGLPDVLERSVHEIRKLASASDAYVMLLDDRRDHLVMAATTDQRQFVRELRLPLTSTSVAVLAATTGRRVVIEDSDNDHRCSLELARKFGHRALVAVPILTGGATCIGVLLLGDNHVRQFTDADLEPALTVANLISLAFSTTRMFAAERERIDQLKRLQEELVNRERLAALGELAAVVAHEVRNPLTVIFNSLSALRKGTTTARSDDGRMLLDIVEEEAERLNSMVGDLLDFVRPMYLHLRPQPLENIISSAMDAAIAVHEGATPRVSVDLSSDIPVVTADGRLLRQAFINLLVNAFQATPADGCVSVHGSLVADGSLSQVCVSVSDTGVGVPPEVVDRVFQPFFTTKATGTGLGLAFVKRIIEAHRGDIAVTSGPGRGTQFSIKLPV